MQKPRGVLQPAAPPSAVQPPATTIFRDPRDRPPPSVPCKFLPWGIQTLYEMGRALGPRVWGGVFHNSGQSEQCYRHLHILAEETEVAQVRGANTIKPQVAWSQSPCAIKPSTNASGYN